MFRRARDDRAGGRSRVVVGVKWGRSRGGVGAESGRRGGESGRSRAVHLRGRRVARIHASGPGKNPSCLGRQEKL